MPTFARPLTEIASRLRRRPVGTATVAVLVSLACSQTVALAADLSIDDRALKTSGSWAKVSAKSASQKTLLRSKKKGATVSPKTDAKSGGSVVFQVGKNRGTATISVGGKTQATVKTSAKKTSFKT